MFPLPLLPTITTCRARLSAAGFLGGKIHAYRVEPRLIRVDLDGIEAKIIHTVPTVDRQS
jgi:hypothetical protein